jgi:protein-tyrosine-phosphatase
MTDRAFNVLFLCTGNSARSILAESVLRKDGGGRFNAYSAGSRPQGRVNPLALKTLEAFEYPVEGFRSKSWEEFTAPDAPILDFVFTVCDSAAGEVCPVWPGQPMTAHWGIEDPAAVEGTTIRRNPSSIFCRIAQSRFAMFRKTALSASATSWRRALFSRMPLGRNRVITLAERPKREATVSGATQ